MLAVPVSQAGIAVFIRHNRASVSARVLGLRTALHLRRAIDRSTSQR